MKLVILCLVACASLGFAADKPAYKVPKTPWGEPDISGNWPTTNLNFQVPLQRPVDLGDRQTLTEAEYKQREQRAQETAKVDAEQFAKPETKPGLGPPSYWVERGAPVYQTSLIIAPANGRLPALTATAIEREQARDAKFHETYKVDRKVKGTNESWIDDVLALVEPADHSLYVRCVSRGILGSMTPSGYNNGVRISQSPGYVVIEYEMIHEARVIPTDNRPHSDPRIRSHMGDAVGHWEGNTLVVETTNFVGNQNGVTGNGGGTPTSDKMVYTERITRIDPNTLVYQATINDPDTWVAPWTVKFPLQRDDKYIWSEYACHEGNYAMRDILIGADRDIAAAKK